MSETGPRHRTDPQKNLVGFVVGPVAYAVDISRVREIVNPLEVTPLPHMPPDVAGVADHRGEVIPVIELRARFGLESADNVRSTKWILLHAGGDRSVGIIVDSVTEVFGALEGIRPTPEVGGNRDLRGIAGVVTHNGRLTFVLETGRFIEIFEALAASGVL
jgi:purine-binding chemotaxis protein CheW